MRSLKIVAPLVITLSAAVALSGCALFPAAQELQSKVTACLQLTDALTAVGEDISAASGDLATDPQAGADKIADVAAEFRTAADAITNVEVRDAALETSEALDEFSEVISAYALDPENADFDELSASGENVTNLMTGLEEVCSS